MKLMEYLNLILVVLLLGSLSTLAAQNGEGEVNSSDEAIYEREKGGALETIGNLMILPIAAIYKYGNMDLESGAVFTGYSDVRIPGDSGTLFSLSDDLKAEVAPSFRVRINLPLGERHNISLLAAPLIVYSEGEAGKDISFADTTFDAGTRLKGTYWFNSYRLTYRYNFINTFRNELGLGLTGKIREAGITLSGGGKKGKKTNVGFVPLINFRYNRYLGEDFSFLLEGDALAAKQGRAEDVFAGFTFKPADGVKLKLGYRMLEGGADVDETYNFAMLHYAVFGVILGKG